MTLPHFHNFPFGWYIMFSRVVLQSGFGQLPSLVDFLSRQLHRGRCGDVSFWSHHSVLSQSFIFFLMKRLIFT